jgi:hypothetical protein
MQKSNEPKGWCSLPWSHLQILPGGNFRPCCRFLTSEMPTQSADIETANDYFFSSFMQELREKMLRGEKVAGCQKCIDEEAAGKRFSNRQNYNQRPDAIGEIDHAKPKIRFLELALSNLCNSSCVICGPLFSNFWAKDYSKIHGKELSGPSYKTMDVTSVYDSLSDLFHIKFTGGEPLLIPEYHEILETLVANGRAKDVYLNYSTNLTILPSDRLILLWKKFRFIEIACSLDAIGPLAEFIRYPAKWEKIEKTTTSILSLSRNLDLRCGLRTSVSAYNIVNLPETIGWWISQVNQHYKEPFGELSWMNPTHIQVPEYLSANVLPATVKGRITNYLQANSNFNSRTQRAIEHLVRYMNQNDRSDLFPKLVHYTKRLESVRGINFFATNPLMEEFAGKEWEEELEAQNFRPLQPGSLPSLI